MFLTAKRDICTAYSSLCTNLELEADCKNVCKKKFSSLNRTELGDYLLKKLKETEKVIEAVPTVEGVTAPIMVPNTSSATDMLEDVTTMENQECSKKFTLMSICTAIMDLAVLFLRAFHHVQTFYIYIIFILVVQKMICLWWIPLGTSIRSLNFIPSLFNFSKITI